MTLCCDWYWGRKVLLYNSLPSFDLFPFYFFLYSDFLLSMPCWKSNMFVLAVQFKPSSDHLILCFFQKMSMVAKWNQIDHWSKICAKEREVKHHKSEMQEFWRAQNLYEKNCLFFQTLAVYSYEGETFSYKIRV